MKKISQDELTSILKLNSLWDDSSNDGEVASFKEMDLSGLVFKSCFLTEIEFEDCNLSNCEFRNCVFLGCAFSNCDLSDTDFDTVVFEGLPGGNECTFNKCNVSGYADCSNLSFLNVIFESCTFDNFYAPEIRIVNSTIIECKFINTSHFGLSEIVACNFSNTTFDEYQADGSIMAASNFNNCSFTDVNLDHSRLNNNNFIASTIEANFYSSSLTNSKFINSKVIGSNMRFCDLSECNFIDTDVFEADIKGAKGLESKSIMSGKVNNENKSSVASYASNLIKTDSATKIDLIKKIKDRTYSEVGPDGRPLDIK